MAERFKRRPAEPLYMGSTPIPGSNTEPLYSEDIAKFLWALKKEGLKETTIIQNYSKVLKHLNKNCKLNNPDSILSYIAVKEVSEGRKELTIDVIQDTVNGKVFPSLNLDIKDKIGFLMFL